MAKLNINTALAKELEAIKGISKSTANKIIRYRKRNGLFLSKRDIEKVDGIGPATYKKISPYIIASTSVKSNSIKKSLWNIAKSTLTEIANKKIDEYLNAESIKSNKQQKKKSYTKKAGRVYKFDKYGKTNKLPILVEKSNPKFLNDNQIKQAAKKHHLEFAAIKAVIAVESSGRGYLRNGKVKILFEGHIFWNQLQAKQISPAKYQKQYPNIIYPKWTKRYYKGGNAEHKRLALAKKINNEAALKSASWGMFQIMGFNHNAAGYQSVEAFVKAMQYSEANQLNAFLAFVKHKKLKSALANKQWAKFARGYNGAGFKKNQYDKRLANAYKKYSLGTVYA